MFIFPDKMDDADRPDSPEPEPEPKPEEQQYAEAIVAAYKTRHPGQTLTSPRFTLWLENSEVVVGNTLTCRVDLTGPDGKAGLGRGKHRNPDGRCQM